MLGLDVIDAHHHLCRLSSVSYPWLQGPPTPRYHGVDLDLRRDYLVEDYLKDASGLGQLDARLVGSVHVENGAADPLAEAAWIDQVIADHAVPTVQVVKVDLTAPNARDQLAEHATRTSVRGVRDILNWHANPVYTHRDHPDLMTDPAWLDGFRAVGELGLSFDLQVFPHQLDAAAELAAAHGNISIVLDHAGMPIDRDSSALTDWRRALTRFAAAPNTTVKISALGTNDHQWTVNSIRQIVLDTIDTFGPDRCMFASNFPVDGLYSSYSELYRAFDHLTRYLDYDERTALFAGTSRRVYRMDPDPLG